MATMARSRKPEPLPPSPPDEVRAAIYVRVSTDEQARDGYGLEAQRRKCRAMAEVKGWRVADEYADEGISGTKDASKRPALNRLMNDARERRIDAVIVAGLDRLGRQSRIILNLVDELAQAGVEFVSCKESFDTSTPVGRFTLTLFAGLAQLDRDNIVQRTTEGRDERGRKDGEKGGKLPYGYYRIVGDGIGIDETASETVRLIFALRGGGSSQAAIASILNNRGISTAQGGSQWYQGTVRQILNQEAIYRGGQRGDSPRHWPVILSNVAEEEAHHAIDPKASAATEHRAE
jgi:site-specific DNA recombinase